MPRCEICLLYRLLFSISVDPGFNILSKAEVPPLRKHTLFRRKLYVYFVDQYIYIYIRRYIKLGGSLPDCMLSQPDQRQFERCRTLRRMRRRPFSLTIASCWASPWQLCSKKDDPASCTKCAE